MDRVLGHGEGRVNCLDSGWTTLLDAMVSPKFTFHRHFHILCSFSKSGHPRMVSFSVASFSTKRSSF